MPFQLKPHAQKGLLHFLNRYRHCGACICLIAMLSASPICNTFRGFLSKSAPAVTADKSFLHRILCEISLYKEVSSYLQQSLYRAKCIFFDNRGMGILCEVFRTLAMIAEFLGWKVLRLVCFLPQRITCISLISENIANSAVVPFISLPCSYSLAI